jgi:hypothetical protein
LRIKSKCCWWSWSSVRLLEKYEFIFLNVVWRLIDLIIWIDVPFQATKETTRKEVHIITEIERQIEGHARKGEAYWRDSVTTERKLKEHHNRHTKKRRAVSLTTQHIPWGDH